MADIIRYPVYSGRIYHNKNMYYIIDDIAIVFLTQGKSCVIDVCNMDILDEHVWHCSPRGLASSKNLLMHKYLIDRLFPDKQYDVYHNSDDRLDNRMCNLSFLSSIRRSKRISEKR